MCFWPQYEENKNLFKNLPYPNFPESHLHKNLFRLTWKNLGSYNAGFYCIIFLFSPVTANSFFSDENDLITYPRFSGGSPIILTWVWIASKAELIFSSAVISSKGLKTPAFRSLQVQATQILVQGWGSRTRISELLRGRT